MSLANQNLSGYEGPAGRKFTRLIKPSELGEVYRDDQFVTYYNKSDPTNADFTSVSATCTEGLASNEDMLDIQFEGFKERTKAANKNGKLGTVQFMFASVLPGTHPYITNTACYIAFRLVAVTPETHPHLYTT